MEDNIKKLIQEEVQTQLRDELDQVMRVITPDSINIETKTKIFDGRSFQLGTEMGWKIGTTTDQKVYFIANVIMDNLPTSAAGLESGQLWNNSGVVNIA